MLPRRAAERPQSILQSFRQGHEALATAVIARGRLVFSVEQEKSRAMISKAQVTALAAGDG